MTMEITWSQSEWKYSKTFQGISINSLLSSESVILGGTHQYNDFNLKVSEDDDKFIMEGCQKLIPGIKHAPLIKQWVGLRPGRSTIRLETELMDNGKEVQMFCSFSHFNVSLSLSLSHQVFT